MNLAKRTVLGLLTTLLAPVSFEANAQSGIQSGFEQSTAILDTSVLFAIGAQEADQALRGSFGWPTFQEGFVEGVYFRFDPDGYARFSPSPRLDEDVFETICVEASTACIAKKGVLQIGLTPGGQVQIRIDGINPDDTVFVSDRKTELPLPPSVLEPLVPRLESLLSGGGELIIKREIEVVQSISLAGFAAVSTYLRWVAQNQSPRVFPRGWPVPAQSQNQAFAGLTQPNQWETPNAGPQAAQTTWHIQQRQAQNRGATVANPLTAPQTQAFQPAGGFQQAAQTGTQVGQLQQQILQLQNNLLQMQSNNVTAALGAAPQAGAAFNQAGANDLQEFGQSFAQQAHGRSLPASPGVLGVGGATNALTPRNAGADPFGNPNPAYQAPVQRQQGFEPPPPAELTYVMRRLEMVEKSLLEMRRDMSLQMLELREDVVKQGQVQRGGLTVDLGRPAVQNSIDPQRLMVQPSPQNSAAVLEELEKNLLARLGGQSPQQQPTQAVVNLEPDNASVNRQLIEDILTELTKKTETPGLQAAPATPEPVGEGAAATDDYVTLNDYINQVLRNEAGQTPSPGR